MLPVLWVSSCFLLGAFIGALNNAGKLEAVKVLSRTPHVPSLPPGMIYPWIADPIGLPVSPDSPIGLPILPPQANNATMTWTNPSHIIWTDTTYDHPLPDPQALSHDGYIAELQGLLMSQSTLVFVVFGAAVSLFIVAHLVVTCSQPRFAFGDLLNQTSPQMVDHAVGTTATADDAPPKAAPPCEHMCSTCSANNARLVTNVGKVRAELVRLRSGVETLGLRTSEVERILHELKITRKELRDILEAIKTQAHPGSPDSSTPPSSSPTPDHDAFSDAPVSPDTVLAENTADPHQTLPVDEEPETHLSGSSGTRPVQETVDLKLDACSGPHSAYVLPTKYTPEMALDAFYDARFFANTENTAGHAVPMNEEPDTRFSSDALPAADINCSIGDDHDHSSAAEPLDLEAPEVPPKDLPIAKDLQLAPAEPEVVVTPTEPETEVELPAPVEEAAPVEEVAEPVRLEESAPAVEEPTAVVDEAFVPAAEPEPEVVAPAVEELVVIEGAIEGLAIVEELIVAEEPVAEPETEAEPAVEEPVTVEETLVPAAESEPEVASAVEEVATVEESSAVEEPAAIERAADLAAVEEPATVEEAPATAAEPEPEAAPAVEEAPAAEPELEAAPVAVVEQTATVVEETLAVAEETPAVVEAAATFTEEVAGED